MKFNNLLVLIITGAIISSCATLSFDEPKLYSETIPATTNTSLGRDVDRWLQAHEGLSGFYPLAQGMDALGVRLRLAERAEVSIDLQYFLMKNDTAGTVLVKSLLKAADRGVRVRFLLDDIFTKAPDRALLLLDQHDNIEVRVFNPISRRGIWALNFITSFKQANRRMHTKSFTVDNVASVVGGRNIADEYFQLKDGNVFVDFDVVAVGPIAGKVSKNFDLYWNHSHALPIDYFASNKKNEDLESVRAEVGEMMRNIYNTVYQQSLESDLLQDLMAERVLLVAANARLLSDSPDKLINKVGDEYMQLANDLGEVLRNTEKEVIVITPYYVPRDRGIQSLGLLTERGLRVVIITNSLASTNHVPVHSGYAKHRKDILRVGVELYELRANAGREFNNRDDDPEAMTLHTKLILFDRRYLFVGSLNLDPRSLELNAEMGLLIDSPELAGGIADAVEQRLPVAAYRLVNNNQDKLEWHTRIDGVEIIETKEPLTNWQLRLKAWFMRIVPDSQL